MVNARELPDLPLEDDHRFSVSRISPLDRSASCYLQIDSIRTNCSVVSDLQGQSPQALSRHEPSPEILLLGSQRSKVAASSSQFRGKVLMGQSLVRAGWKKGVRELPF